MFIPRYWSEASHLERTAERRQVTIRRFGWSSTSQADADANARQRVEEALAALRDGGPKGLSAFVRRERTVAYSGADGLPIREEVVAEHPREEAVVTRNAYGARCLNTTCAMFVDVDAPRGRTAEAGCLGALLGAALGAGVGWALRGVSPVPVAVAGFVLFGFLATRLERLWGRWSLRSRDPARWAAERARAWCERRAGWRVAVYRTPAGARLLPLHATFDAGDPASFEFMEFVRADPLYQRMCRLQKCFRARVSPKPWRAGIAERFRAGGTWPVREPDKLARRAEWVQRYERTAQGYASCRLVETVGSGPVDPRVEAVQSLHDDLCRAGSRLELA